jgi:drug/metabolite transporter (DMT)-like permease
MVWIILALLGALANAAYFITAKHYLRTIPPYTLAAGGYLTTGVLLLVISFFHGVPPVGAELFTSLAGTLVLNVIATVLIYESLKASDLSLSIPMLSFTPIFLIATSFLFLGEIPTAPAVVGIIAVVAGSFILTASAGTRTLREALAALIRAPGSRYMLMVAFLFSVALNFDRKVLANSDPVFGPGLLFIGLGTVFFILMRVRPSPAVIDEQAHVLIEEDRTGPQRNLVRELGPFLVTAVFLAIDSIAINSAFLFQIVPCVIAVKRMSILFTVIYGVLIFHENALLQRVTGASFMVAGAVLIALFN